METTISTLPLNYKTIKTTKSRIDKGLLAIPVSIIDIFPKEASKVVLVNEFGIEEVKKFTPHNSNSRECRIGGLKQFYDKYNIVDNDEIVIQLLDDGKFRLLPEKLFINELNKNIEVFENSVDDAEMETQLNVISKIANTDKDTFIRNEYVRLINSDVTERKIKVVNNVNARETVPKSIRKILMNLYRGKCQITGFTFIQKNGQPYFELHHILPNKGNHLKNLLVVSPNIHKQFSLSNHTEYFDKQGWLRTVKFNDDRHSVYQIIDEISDVFVKEIHF